MLIAAGLSLVRKLRPDRLRVHVICWLMQRGSFFVRGVALSSRLVLSRRLSDYVGLFTVVVMLINLFSGAFNVRDLRPRS